MDDLWPTSEFQSIDQFGEWLCEGTTGIIYRGQESASWGLVSSIDRNPAKQGDFMANLDDENSLVRSFAENTTGLLGTIESKFCENITTSMMVMQHYGAPTRLLDWTRSRAVAAYFACLDAL